jgi:hypothetical protein
MIGKFCNAPKLEHGKVNEKTVGYLYNLLYHRIYLFSLVVKAAVFKLSNQQK